MRRAARVDANHPAIKAEFIALGYSVLDVSQLKNCCDLIVSKRLETVAVEVKDGSKSPSKRKLTDGEADFKNSWLGRYSIIESVADVHNLHRQLFCNLEK